MSQSFAYIKQKLSWLDWRDGDERDFEFWTPHCFMYVLPYKRPGAINRQMTYDHDHPENIKDCFTQDGVRYELQYDPDADFNCYVATDSVHGSIWERVNMAECVDKVFRLCAYNREIGWPTKGDTVKYTMGNLIYHREPYVYTKDSPEVQWTGLRKIDASLERHRVFLPVKYEIVHP